MLFSISAFAVDECHNVYGISEQYTCTLFWKCVFCKLIWLPPTNNTLQVYIHCRSKLFTFEFWFIKHFFFFSFLFWSWILHFTCIVYIFLKKWKCNHRIVWSQIPLFMTKFCYLELAPSLYTFYKLAFHLGSHESQEKNTSIHVIQKCSLKTVL